MRIRVPDKRMWGIVRAVSTMVLIVLATADSGTFLYAEAPTWSLGMRSGVLVGVTDLTDEESVSGQLFVRRSVAASWTLEAVAGFGRIAGQEYATDLVLADVRAIIKPFQSGSWRPHLFAGLGVSRHDIDELTTRATPDQKRSGWSAIVPVGVGFETALTQRVSFEISSAYAYSFRDDLEGVGLRKGNDALWFAQLGLTFTPAKGRSGRQSQIPPVPRFEAPPPSPADVPVKHLERADRRGGIEISRDESPPAADGPDRDGDGLSDREETTRTFTNPFMPDSDGDGLDDRAEVTVHGTNPNRPDSDEDGVGDAEEIRAGQNPLIANRPITAERGAESAKEPAVTETAFEFRTVFFEQGGVTLTAADRLYLDRVAAHLIANPNMELELHGYSDNVGKWAVNLRLSGKRCGVVRDYLVERGAENWRLTLEAFGEADPIASNDTAEGRSRNRRVEFKPVR